MKWKKALPILGLWVGFASPAWAQDELADSSGDAAKPTPSADESIAPDQGASAAESGKFVLGLRLGYALPMGSLANNPDGSSSKMTDGVAGHFPIWLDLGYMVSPNVMLGAYAQYAFGSVAGDLKRACDQASSAGISCSAHDIRLGFQAQYHVAPQAMVNPWFGLGVGYELLTIGFSGAGQSGSTTAEGFEFANLQAGADIKALPNLGVGPFVSFSFGQYGSVSNSGSVAEGGSGGDIENKAIHEWLTLGVRGAFKL